jgi:hypothetical protein
VSWPSEPGWPLILTCDHVAELAAGATPYPVYISANGVREAGEPAITSAGVSFWSVDDDDQYGSANTHDGSFSFTVPSKKYYAEVQVWRSQWRFTTPDVDDDTTDSDVTQVSEGSYYRTARSPEFTVVVGGTVTVDIGLVGRHQFEMDGRAVRGQYPRSARIPGYGGRSRGRIVPPRSSRTRYWLNQMSGSGEPRDTRDRAVHSGPVPYPQASAPRSQSSMTG